MKIHLKRKFNSQSFTVNWSLIFFHKVSQLENWTSQNTSTGNISLQKFQSCLIWINVFQTLLLVAQHAGVPLQATSVPADNLPWLLDRFEKGTKILQHINSKAFLSIVDVFFAFSLLSQLTDILATYVKVFTVLKRLFSLKDVLYEHIKSPSVLIVQTEQTEINSHLQ